MNVFYHICIGLSLGIIIGFLTGGIRSVHKRNYTEQQIKTAKVMIGRMAKVLKYITFLFLALGFVWCVYFLVLGITTPSQAEYANSMSELIVSVLTVVSIIFAFVEFLRNKKDDV